MPDAKKPDTVNFGAIVQAMLTDSAITQARMFGSPALKASGQVFAILVKGKLVLKLPRERAQSLIEAGEGAYFDQGDGRPLRDWIAIEAGTQGTWKDLVREARTFVSTN